MHGPLNAKINIASVRARSQTCHVLWTVLLFFEHANK